MVRQYVRNRVLGDTVLQAAFGLVGEGASAAKNDATATLSPFAANPIERPPRQAIVNFL